LVKEQYLGGHIDNRLHQCKETKTTQKRLASDGGSIGKQHSYSGGLVKLLSEIMVHQKVI